MSARSSGVKRVRLLEIGALVGPAVRVESDAICREVVGSAQLREQRGLVREAGLDRVGVRDAARIHDVDRVDFDAPGRGAIAVSGARPGTASTAGT